MNFLLIKLVMFKIVLLWIFLKNNYEIYKGIFDKNWYYNNGIFFNIYYRLRDNILSFYLWNKCIMKERKI